MDRGSDKTRGEVIYHYRPRIYKEIVIQSELVEVLNRHKANGCKSIYFDLDHFYRDAGQRLWRVEATKYVKEEAS